MERGSSKQIPTCFGRDERVFFILTKRRKWSLKSSKQKAVHQIVLWNWKTKRVNWNLGRIIATFLRKDTVISVVKVQTKEKTYLRLVASLTLLEFWNWCLLYNCLPLAFGMNPHWKRDNQIHILVNICTRRWIAKCLEWCP